MHYLVLSPLRIGFLGAGRMSQALIRGLIEGRIVASKDQLIASDVDENQRKIVTVRHDRLFSLSLFFKYLSTILNSSLNWVSRPQLIMKKLPRKVIF